MQQQAIDKINAEMAEKSTNPYIQLIGQYLLNLITDETAKQVLEANRTIEGSLKTMAIEAKKKAVNGMAMLTDEEGYAIVLTYFGIEQDPQPAKVSKSNKKVKSAKPKQTKAKEKVVNFPGNECIQMSIDNFLGEPL